MTSLNAKKEKFEKDIVEVQKLLATHPRGMAITLLYLLEITNILLKDIHNPELVQYLDEMEEVLSSEDKDLLKEVQLYTEQMQEKEV